MTQEEIDNQYRQFQVNRMITKDDLISFYDILFQTSNIRHYETWLHKANRLYDACSDNQILILIGKVESLLEKIYASC